MTKVTVHETPSEQVVKDARKEVIVTDAGGRQIKLAKPAVLAQFRLVKMLGQASSNTAYMSMLFPMLFVAAINGDPVGFPNSELEIEALIQRLDEDGLAAVMEGVQANFAAVDQEAAADAVKL